MLGRWMQGGQYEPGRGAKLVKVFFFSDLGLLGLVGEDLSRALSKLTC